MTIFWEGVLVIGICYAAVFALGIWSSCQMEGHSELEMMNAGKSLGVIVGTITLVGTWVGGGYITGVSERIYEGGLINVQVPVGYSVAFLIGAAFFVRPMRERDYVTLIDLFQELYGMRYGAVLVFPVLMAEFFWAASVLNSLGTTLEVILHIDPLYAIMISSFFAGLYTIIGGLVSVSYTDIAQLAFIILGLVLAAPFVAHSPLVDTSRKSDFMGHIETGHIGTYIDDYITLFLGGIPLQSYFQRVFSIKNTELAQRMSVWSVIGCGLIAIPSTLMGYYALKTDWEKVEGYGKQVPEEDYVLVLPLVLRYLTPKWVGVFGMGAVSGAVMASADSALLASSSMLTRNVYKHCIRVEAKDFEVVLVLRITIAIVTCLATMIALCLTTVYHLAFLSTDLVFVMIFPQLTICLYFADHTNVYGSFFAYLYGFIMRLTAGEPHFGIPCLIKYPLFDYERHTQGFPYRTTIMLTSAALFFLVSMLAEYLFVTKGIINPKSSFSPSSLCFPLHSYL
ncbi:hypothetical protein A483_HHAL011772 [Halyomorpha halys]|nr:hypothetical protein A483_HHAL011772 [Halyomorpha halys]